MQYYRCKCGKQESWSSMGVGDCQGCYKCNTTLELHPDEHKVPVPHEWTTVEEIQDGVKISEHTYCKRCMQVKSKG